MDDEAVAMTDSLACTVTGPVSRQLDGQVGFAQARKQVSGAVLDRVWDQVRTLVKNRIFDQAREEYDG